MAPIILGALDAGDSARFTSIFLASSFFCSQTESTPAPAPVTQTLPEELYAWVNIITPNETEAGFLVGFAVVTQGDAARAAKIINARGSQQVIIKMGSRGVLARIDREEKYYPAFPVTPIDTVAAGDAFNGALAVALSEAKSIDEAIRWGLAGGALSVTREGAQPAMADRNELLMLLAHNQLEGSED